MAHKDEELDDLLDELLEENPKVTVVFEFPHLSGGDGGGGGGGGPSIGDIVDSGGGGGVVVDVTESTVTVEFPNGLPTESVTLPGIDVTVVVEESSTEEDSGVQIAPWNIGDTLTLPGSMLGSDEGVVTADSLHRSFRLRCPGGEGNYLFLPAGHTLLLSPTNTGTCPCSIFLASMDVHGKILMPHVILKPGKSVPIYELVPGASLIVAACAGNCISQGGCFSELTISFGAS